jgi:hypothetical protein
MILNLPQHDHRALELIGSWTKILGARALVGQRRIANSECLLQNSPDFVIVMNPDGLVGT